MATIPKSGEAQARSLRRREVPPLDEGVAFGLPRVQVPVELIEADLALVAEQLAHLDVEGPDDDVDEADLALRDGRGVPVEEGRDLLTVRVGVRVRIRVRVSVRVSVSVRVRVRVRMKKAETGRPSDASRSPCQKNSRITRWLQRACSGCALVGLEMSAACTAWLWLGLGSGSGFRLGLGLGLGLGLVLGLGLGLG